ncbi:adenosylcobyric acid synthase (glutamine-hydrolysing) [Lachnotalea glycerini]|uniref:Cobyric acid synthase n=1 Tax=Lachnotalea glycerini TaxID=1763509 RepID=A0A255ITE6_9FIRM|nr:cobyric acid synthase [Lachnotalea glycerini]PXV95803.1 adenosylcobyric acid synthase (glutamine-hydrolysing) [Lachnotalea glycerini]RDY33134.1 cobyric acid synthase [Lachnotalea glycerini]
MAKAIMIQGTMSNAGKSLIVAGLCRIFKQDGYKTAPFKSQNMALNSYITSDGLEMGRAQVMQAEAAKIAPSVLMNPILLKPTNDVGSQVIVNGEVIGNMSAVDYFKYKKKLIPDILKAYQSLSDEFDIIVIEGAGSPAEINLKSEDIVNMGMAKLANAPVLIAGDIDRGGVFAQLVGTVSLLEEDERKMVKGTIINKFRGDKSILMPGLTMLEEKTNIPVVGVIPYMYIDIEDEDSLTERFQQTKKAAAIDIVVIKLPRISNFTDFNSIERIEGISVRFVEKVHELQKPDMIIIPGTKNTMGDLLWMRQNGLEAAILKAASNETIIFGVCGGYQMLGEELSDPYAVESGGDMKGMGLLPIKTVFEERKTRTRVLGSFETIDAQLSHLSDVKLKGYEIHMGVTTMLNSQVRPLTRIKEISTSQEDHFEKYKWDGAYLNNIYGSYIHGIFDEEEVTRKLILSLGIKLGLKEEDIKSVDYEEYKEKQYDALADGLRENLDMKAIYQILEEGL